MLITCTNQCELLVKSVGWCAARILSCSDQADQTALPDSRHICSRNLTNLATWTLTPEHLTTKVVRRAVSEEAHQYHEYVGQAYRNFTTVCNPQSDTECTVQCRCRLSVGLKRNGWWRRTRHAPKRSPTQRVDLEQLGGATSLRRA